jgi:hypothetical protein
MPDYPAVFQGRLSAAQQKREPTKLECGRGYPPYGGGYPYYRPYP